MVAVSKTFSQFKKLGFYEPPKLQLHACVNNLRHLGEKKVSLAESQGWSHKEGKKCQLTSAAGTLLIKVMAAW